MHADLICGAETVPVNNAIFNLQRIFCGGPGPHKLTVAKLEQETPLPRPHELVGAVVVTSYSRPGARRPEPRDLGPSETAGLYA